MTRGDENFEQLKKQRIDLLSRVLTLLEREVLQFEKGRKKVPRELCEKLRIVGNELRVEQRPGKPMADPATEETEIKQVQSGLKVLRQKIKRA